MSISMIFRLIRSSFGLLQVGAVLGDHDGGIVDHAPEVEDELLVGPFGEVGQELTPLSFPGECFSGTSLRAS